MKLFLLRVLQNLWSLLIILIVIDLALIPADFLLGRFGGFLFGLLGLFIPNFLGQHITLFGGGKPEHPMFAFALTCVVIALANWIAPRIGISPRLRILYNFGILFALTFLVDWILWGEWTSWHRIF